MERNMASTASYPPLQNRKDGAPSFVVVLAKSKRVGHPPVDCIVPALAKFARTGHPLSWWYLQSQKGWATRPPRLSVNGRYPIRPDTKSTSYGDHTHL